LKALHWTAYVATTRNKETSYKQTGGLYLNHIDDVTESVDIYRPGWWEIRN
jgi:hypothetical protein